MTELKAFEKPEHEGNSPTYHTGKPCVEKGCKNPAGTWWSPLWCMEHNIARLHRITNGLNEAVARAELAKAVDVATASLHSHCDRLIRQRDEAALINWKPLGDLKIKDRDVLLTVGSGWIVHSGRWKEELRKPNYHRAAGWFANSGGSIDPSVKWYAEIPDAPSEAFAAEVA